jgi:hypothetical protein
MDDRNLHRWREQAREHAIAEPEIDRWLGLARPHLTLYRAQTDPAATDASPADPPVVGYRGGRPSLPPDVEWAGESGFVAAVDCAALPRDLPGFPLPEDGHLLFFHFDHGDQPSFLGGDGWVSYMPAETVTAERDPAHSTDMYDEAVRKGVEPEPFPLQCWQHWDPPNLECHGEFGFGSPGPFIESMPEGFMELVRVLEDPRPAHVRDNETLVLGGYCRTESDACAGAEYTDSEHRKWRLLASMVRDVYDGREGVPHLIHWIIREDDLAARNFEDVQTHTVCLWA